MLMPKSGIMLYRLKECAISWVDQKKDSPNSL